MIPAFVREHIFQRLNSRPQSKQIPSEKLKTHPCVLVPWASGLVGCRGACWRGNIPDFLRPRRPFHTLTHSRAGLSPVSSRHAPGRKLELARFLSPGSFLSRRFVNFSLPPGRREPFQEWLWVVHTIAKDWLRGIAKHPVAPWGRSLP